MPHPAYAWLIHTWPALLALSALVLFADNALYNIPLFIMALLALSQLVRHFRPLLTDRCIVLLIVVFAALWLPQLIALIDAYHWPEALRVAAAYPGYGLAALFMALYLREPQQLHILISGMVVIVTFWCVDALLAAGGAWAFMGYSPDPSLVTGMLFPKLAIGHVLAVLLPGIIEWARRRQQRQLLAWLIVAAVIVVILLSGRRVAWMMLILALAGYALYTGVILKAVRFRTITLVCMLGLVGLGITYWQHEPFAGRVDKTLELLAGEVGTIDQATSHRLDIWQNGLRMATDHWVNGIGSRGYRYAYADYADADDFWLNEHQTSALHPHLFLLEIVIETGLIGLLGYLIAWLCLMRILLYTSDSTIWVAGLSVTIALFPLNAHMAFYGSYWTAFSWWLLGLLFAVCPQSLKQLR